MFRRPPRVSVFYISGEDTKKRSRKAPSSCVPPPFNSSVGPHRVFTTAESGKFCFRVQHEFNGNGFSTSEFYFAQTNTTVFGERIIILDANSTFVILSSRKK